jgi:hypothetical protein
VAGDERPPERIARRDRGGERRDAEAADGGHVADAAVADEADASPGEHPSRQQLPPAGDIQAATGREYDDRPGRRRVDGGELVLVRVLEQLVVRDRGDRERTAGDRRRGRIDRPDAVLHRLRAVPEPIEDVCDHRHREDGEPCDLAIWLAVRHVVVAPRQRTYTI